MLRHGELRNTEQKKNSLSFLVIQRQLGFYNGWSPKSHYYAFARDRRAYHLPRSIAPPSPTLANQDAVPMFQGCCAWNGAYRNPPALEKSDVGSFPGTGCAAAQRVFMLK